MSQPKRHHYLPESYLARFTREGTPQSVFWIYDIKLRKLRDQTPRNTGVQGYYNAVERPDGSRDFGLENALSTIESDMSVLLPKIECREPLNETDRATLATFSALQRLRVPEFEEEFNLAITAIMRMAGRVAFANEERAKIMIDQFERQTGKQLGLTPVEMIEEMHRADRPIETHRNDSLRTMVNLLPDTAKRLARMDWVFLHAPDDRAFVTTDSPFVLVEPDDLPKEPMLRQVGYGTRGTRKLFPLSSRTGLMMLDAGSRIEHHDATEANVRWFNEHVAGEAYRYVIGRDKELVKSLVRTFEKAERRLEFTWGGSKLKVS